QASLGDAVVTVNKSGRAESLFELHDGEILAQGNGQIFDGADVYKNNASANVGANIFVLTDDPSKKNAAIKGVQSNPEPHETHDVIIIRPGDSLLTFERGNNGNLSPSESASYDG